MDNVKNKYPDVFDYVLTEEASYRTHGIPLASNWNWSMYKHIDMSFQLKNSQFTKGDNSVDNFTRPNKNIIIPIANVNYRTEGFDVKDNELYVDSQDYFHLSLLARKFHDKWAIKYSIDTAIDESVESYFDYGLAIAKNVNEERPEIIPLQSIAFCDQTDFMAGPKCFKHSYTVGELLDMKGKWYDDAIDRTVVQAEFTKSVPSSNNIDAQTPGKNVEVYELHGTFPDSWLEDGQSEDTGTYSKQLHIITYYVDSETQGKNGICLYKGKEPKEIFKVIKRDPIHGRACGRGGIEELFHSQIWTNFSEIHLLGMLKETSKVVLQSATKNLLQKNRISKVDNGLVIEHEEGKPLTQVVIQPLNKPAFDAYVNSWEQNARTIGSASDPQLGLNPVSGTPLGTTQIVTDQGQGVHEYRRGKIAIFWGEIYRDWVLSYLQKEMAQGDEWLDELSVDELREVAERVAVSSSNSKIKKMVLEGKMPTEQDRQMMTQVIKDEFSKGGTKRFLKIMKGEFEKLPLKVKFSIKGKQKNLYEVVNKLNGIFQTIFKAPQILQQPGMARLFNDILESSGLNPIDFATLSAPPEQQGNPQDAQQGAQQPTQQGAVPSSMQMPALQTNQ